MGNYFGRGGKKETDTREECGSETESRREKVFQTVYRPHIFIDFFKSQLYKVRYEQLLRNVYKIIIIDFD